jgi:hypothetical protein
MGEDDATGWPGRAFSMLLPGGLSAAPARAKLERMRRQGSGFGFVVMLIVLAVIFFLAMNNFRRVAPTAIEIQKHNQARKAGQEVKPEEFEPKSGSTSSSADAWTPAPPSRPSLGTMDQRTTQHTDSVKDALSQAE